MIVRFAMPLTLRGGILDRVGLAPTAQRSDRDRGRGPSPARSPRMGFRPCAWSAPLVNVARSSTCEC
jgi:hypothetical protein